MAIKKKRELEGKTDKDSSLLAVSVSASTPSSASSFSSPGASTAPSVCSPDGSIEPSISIEQELEELVSIPVTTNTTANTTANTTVNTTVNTTDTINSTNNTTTVASVTTIPPVVVATAAPSRWGNMTFNADDSDDDKLIKNKNEIEEERIKEKEKEKEKNNNIIIESSNNDNNENNSEKVSSQNENYGSTDKIYTTDDMVDDKLYTPGNSPIRAKKGSSALTVRYDFNFCIHLEEDSWIFLKNKIKTEYLQLRILILNKEVR